MTTAATEIVVAAGTVLGILGGILRYVVRLAVTVNRAADAGAETAKTLERVTDKLEDHGTRLAVLESRVHP